MNDQDHDRLLEVMETMLKCDRRGVCLFGCWIQRYGGDRHNCKCFWLLSECISDSPPTGEDLEDLPY